MSDQLAFLIRLALVVFLVALLWAASVAFTYWDTHNQRMAGGKTMAWLAVVAFLPFIGFTVYILFRALSLYLSSRVKKIEQAPRRVTALKPPAGLRRVMPTIQATEIDLLALDPKQSAQVNPARPGLAAKYIFTITSGAEAGREFVIENLPARIGRGGEAAIALDHDLGVSRKHAEIYELGGQLKIRDLNSAHGTQVNGLRIDDSRLESGHQIQVGTTVLSIKIIPE